MSRIGLYKDWIQGDNLLRLEGWARDGLSDKQIADNIGITTTTLYDWKKRYPVFSNTLKRTKEIVDREVENALYKAAIEGNITAQIFWLKNRKSAVWRDKNDLEVTQNADISTSIANARKRLERIKDALQGESEDKGEVEAKTS